MSQLLNTAITSKRHRMVVSWTVYWLVDSFSQPQYILHFIRNQICRFLLINHMKYVQTSIFGTTSYRNRTQDGRCSDFDECSFLMASLRTSLWRHAMVKYIKLTGSRIYCSKPNLFLVHMKPLILQILFSSLNYRTIYMQIHCKIGLTTGTNYIYAFILAQYLVYNRV